MRNLIKHNVLHIAQSYFPSSGIKRHLDDLAYILHKEINLIVVADNPFHEKSIKFYVLPNLSGWKGILFFIPNLIALMKIVKKHKINIIHTHHRYPEFLAYLLSKMIKVYLVTTAHSYVKGKWAFSFRSNSIITVSRFIKEHLTNNFNVNADKVEIIYNTLLDRGYSILDIRKKFNISANEKIVLYVGRCSKEKNVKLLEKVLSQLPNVRLFVVGADKDLIDGNICYFKPLDDLANYYDNADVVVNPSNMESLSYLMLESGYYKKPFIGTNVGGMKEFIEHGKNGLLFEPGIEEEFLKNIYLVLENPEFAKSLGENLFNKVINNCDPEEYKKKLIAIYDRRLSSIL